MSNEHAEILNRLFEDGYIIQIDNGPFVTGNVNMIENLGGNDYDLDEEPIWVYTDENVTEAPLSKVRLDQVKVMARVDWLQIIPKEDQSIHTHLFGTDVHMSLQDWNDELDNVYDEAGD